MDREKNCAQNGISCCGHETSTGLSCFGRVSSTGTPATIASNARSDGGASVLTTAFDNACSTFERFIPGTLPTALRQAPTTELRCAAYRRDKKMRSCRHLASSENAATRPPPVNPRLRSRSGLWLRTLFTPTLAQLAVKTARPTH